ncbi:MAG: type II secretion system protein GspG [Lentisphaerota bacterium]
MVWESDLTNPGERTVFRVGRGRRTELQPRRRGEPPPRPSAMMLPALLFSHRSRVFRWTLVLSSVIVCRLLFVHMHDAPLLPSERRANEIRCSKELQALRTGLEWFRAHCKRYPTDAEGLRALVRDPGVPGWQGYYVDQLPPDPWGHPYRYGCTNGTVSLRGAGADGLDDTTDDIASPEPDWRALLERVDTRDLPRWDTNTAPAAIIFRP